MDMQKVSNMEGTRPLFSREIPLLKEKETNLKSREKIRKDSWSSTEHERRGQPEGCSEMSLGKPEHLLP